MKIKLIFFQISRGLLLGSLLLLISLGIGMMGYKYFINKSWADAFLNSAMLLTGMGPVDEPETNGGKIFAGIFALYSGIVFLSIVGIITLPFFSKYLIKLNKETANEKS
ncbi:MAG: hypothetical protein ACOZCO_07250 [Bacteroidota bacterium]